MYKHLCTRPSNILYDPAACLSPHVCWLLVRSRRKSRSKSKNGGDSMPFLPDAASLQKSWAQATPRELENPQRSGR